MDPAEHIQNLITSLSHVSSWDEMFAVRRRSQAFIERGFGNSSKYLKELEDAYNTSTWNGTYINIRTILYAILDEVNVFGIPDKEQAFQGMARGEMQKPEITLSNRVFIVHGHDEAMKQSVARVLEKLGLNPIILHEKPNQGRTIIEKFTEYSDVSFAFVLLSSDDLVLTKNQSTQEARPRARQNVIFELGFFIGKLGRARVFVLYQESKNFEMPSDYSGVLYVPYDSIGQWRFELAKELKASGYNIDANKLVS